MHNYFLIYFIIVNMLKPTCTMERLLEVYKQDSSITLCKIGTNNNLNSLKF